MKFKNLYNKNIFIFKDAGIGGKINFKNKGGKLSSEKSELQSLLGKIEESYDGEGQTENFWDIGHDLILACLQWYFLA